MNESTGQQAGGAKRPPAKIVARLRILVAVWLVILGSVFCASGHWWGACYFAGAGLVGWLAYQMPRWKLSRDAGPNGLHPR
ncbi:MAG TPA: hypothetical protein VGD91_23070 [Trebonia sp.]